MMDPERCLPCGVRSGEGKGVALGLISGVVESLAGDPSPTLAACVFFLSIIEHAYLLCMPVFCVLSEGFVVGAPERQLDIFLLF